MQLIWEYGMKVVTGDKQKTADFVPAIVQFKGPMSAYIRQLVLLTLK